jgi:hypothetical protein
MIAYCRNYLKELLQSLKITPVYISQKQADAYQGYVFSHVGPGTEHLKKNQVRVAVEDDKEHNLRRYRYKLYDSILPVYVTIVGKNLDQAEQFRQSFLKALADRILDPDGNAITLEATECDTVQDFSSLQDTREGYQITVVFNGGVYRDKTVNLVTGEIAPVPDIEAKAKEE